MTCGASFSRRNAVHLPKFRHPEQPSREDRPVPDPREELPRAGIEEQHDGQVRLTTHGDVDPRPKAEILLCCYLHSYSIGSFKEFT